MISERYEALAEELKILMARMDDIVYSDSMEQYKAEGLIIMEEIDRVTKEIDQIFEELYNDV